MMYSTESAGAALTAGAGAMYSTAALAPYTAGAGVMCNIHGKSGRGVLLHWCKCRDHGWRDVLINDPSNLTTLHDLCVGNLEPKWPGKLLLLFLTRSFRRNAYVHTPLE